MPWNRLLRTLIINCGLALAVPVLLWCFSPSISGRRFLQLFWISAVYSNSVGLLFGLLSDPLWMRTARLPSPLLVWTARLVVVLLLATAGTALGSAIIVGAGVLPGATFPDFFWDGYRFALVITFAVAAVIALYETMKHRLDVTTLQLKVKELEREKAQKLASEAKLASLESRIHPHFLFNTINSVSALIPEDPAKAERLLGRMSELLRFSLDSPHTGLVSLERELHIVRGYLEIEQARFGDRLQYSVDSAPSQAGISVPPLSIQTLVENSVKFAVAPRRAGGRIEVRTSVARTGGLEVTVADDGPGFEPDAIRPGHGLALLDERLKAQFGDGCGIRYDRNGSRWQVSFTVPGKVSQQP